MAAVACGGRLPLPALDQVDRVRASDGVAESAGLAPDSYARAEQARLDALRAHAAGDDVAATLAAERATAAYATALAAARTARATLEMAAARKSLDDGVVQLQSLEASRTKLEADAVELEKALVIAQGRLRPASSGPALREREAARRVAAEALVTQARLICGCAKLVSPDAEGLGAAESAIASVREGQGPSARGPALVDAAARSRAGCLNVLVRARRASANAVALSDQLLSELSAAGSFNPSIDERGIVVALRDAYRGTQLSDDGSKRLAELGQVAATHPKFAVQVVVHDAVPQATGDVDGRRADAAVRALVAAGASPSSIAPELAGVHAPVADPVDPRSRPRNERLEVVFVPK
jgi:hypothetical protein